MAHPFRDASAISLTIMVSALCLLSLSTSSSPAATEPLPTPRQLVAQIQANRAAFHTFDISSQAVIHTDLKATWSFSDQSSSTHQVHWRANTQTILVNDEQIDANSDAASLKTQTRISPSESQQLKNVPGLAKPQAIVQHESLLDSTLGDPNRIWNQLGPDYLTTKVTDANSKIRRLSSGYYLLRTNLANGEIGSVMIDPRHGFLPIRWDRISSRGDLIAWASASDIRQVSKGLWLPFAYAYGNATAKADFTITTATVNQDLPDSQLTLTFPSSTGSG